jgi:hypothetical protein
MPVGCDGYGSNFFGGMSLMSRTKPIEPVPASITEFAQRLDPDNGSATIESL